MPQSRVRFGQHRDDVRTKGKFARNLAGQVVSKRAQVFPGCRAGFPNALSTNRASSMHSRYN